MQCCWDEHLFLDRSSSAKINYLFSTDSNCVIQGLFFKICWFSCSTVSQFFICIFHLFSLLPGILNLPAVALGIITGGFVLKRFKLGVIGAARVSMAASFGSFCLLCIQVFIHCDNADVAGLTVTYQGWEGNSNVSLFASDPLPPTTAVYALHFPGLPRCRTTTRPCCRNATWDAPARSSTGTRCAQAMGWRTPHPAWLAARLPQAVAGKWWVDDLWFLPGKMKKVDLLTTAFGTK